MIVTTESESRKNDTDQDDGFNDFGDFGGVVATQEDNNSDDDDFADF